ncbi:MAG: hypothetical protein D6B25_14825 [Desulfobulbaceae bacterium]|nr:MAG: hypothetical protein D6B25_14825 [Desulfobulbaceae bacterium]
MLENNPDTVKIVLKNMPLRFHPFADPAARAALAAGEQGKFWEFHDELFSLEELNQQAIDQIAVNLGLNIQKFNGDRNSPAIRQKINKDIRDAAAAGVTGTPTIFVNGRKLKNRSFQGFQALINEELKK